MYPSEPLPYQDLTLFQQKALAITPKITAAFSIIGSAYIMNKIIGKYGKDKLLTTYDRLILGLGISDIMSSFSGFLLSTWPIPKDTKNSYFIWGNVGTEATCEAQGFIFNVFVTAVPIYTASITVQSMLIVRYKWNQAKMNRIEPLFHGIAMIYPLVASSIALVKGFFNPTPGYCWVQSYPLNCELFDEVECVRGGTGIQKIRILLVTLPLVGSVLTIICSMVLLYLAVRKQEKACAKYSSFRLEEKQKNSKIILRRAASYVGVFFLMWVTPATAIFGSKTRTGAKFGLMLINVIVFPLQGIFNAVIYGHLKPNHIIANRFTKVLRKSISTINSSRNSIAKFANEPIIGMYINERDGAGKTSSPTCNVLDEVCEVNLNEADNSIFRNCVQEQMEYTESGENYIEDDESLEDYTVEMKFVSKQRKLPSFFNTSSSSVVQFTDKPSIGIDLKEKDETKETSPKWYGSEEICKVNDKEANNNMQSCVCKRNEFIEDSNECIEEITSICTYTNEEESATRKRQSTDSCNTVISSIVQFDDRLSIRIDTNEKEGEENDPH